METLPAFVRERARWKEPVTGASETMARFYEDAGAAPRPMTDITAVLEGIRRRPEAGRAKEKEQNWRLDLHATDLRLAILGDAHLEGAYLSDAHLESAILREAHL